MLCVCARGGGFDLVLCLFFYRGGSRGVGRWGRRRKVDGVVVFARTRK